MMRTHYKPLGVILVAALLTGTAACNFGAALGLHDWGRDLLAPIYAVLFAAAQQPGPQGEQGLQGEQGVQGEQGPQGEQGEIGPPGPLFFSVYVDEFYRVADANPADVSQQTAPPFEYDGAAQRAVGWRFGVPDRYEGANPITMRLWLTLEYPASVYQPTACQIFELATLTRTDGDVITGFDMYGAAPPNYLEFIVPDTPEAVGDTLMVVVDIPLYGDPAAGSGLGLATLAAGDIVYFGMAWADGDGPGGADCDEFGRQWRIHAAEFIEEEEISVPDGLSISDVAATCTNCP